MGQQGSKELGMNDFRGVTLKELDKHVQAHGQEALSTYLDWLQEQLNDWDLSDTAVFQPQIDSWCASLRFQGFDDQTIFNAFGIWKKNAINSNASNARRFLVAEEVLLTALSLRQAIEQSSPEVEQGRGRVITVRDNYIIDVSSGGEDSEVEFLGWKSPNNTNTGYPYNVDGNNDNQMMLGAIYGDHNAGSKATRARKKSSNQQQKGPVPRGYICKRCKEKGHHVEVCPTNLDPSYDVPPPNPTYECYCCGARGKHLTTLCPSNRNPNSLTQQRIRAGITTGEPSTCMERDSYSPAYNGSRKRARDQSVNTDATYIHEDRRAFVKPDDDDYMNPERRALLERTRPSSQSESKTGSSRGTHHSPPPAKRGRTQSKRQHDLLPESTRHGSQKSHRSRGQSPFIGSEHRGSTELLPQIIYHDIETAGRLSPWEDGDGDCKMSQLASSSSRRAVASDFWCSDSPDNTIQLLFPLADALWVSDMASFDVDRFFVELDAYMENRAVFRDTGAMQAGPDLKFGGVGVTWEVSKDMDEGVSKAGSSQAHGAGLEFLNYDDS